VAALRLQSLLLRQGLVDPWRSVVVFVALQGDASAEVASRALALLCDTRNAIGGSAGSAVSSVNANVLGGVALAFQDGAPGGNATATKDGKSYTISGTATGVDMANPMQPITKPFEIAVTCP
jgi:hypothetical protein